MRRAIATSPTRLKTALRRRDSERVKDRARPREARAGEEARGARPWIRIEPPSSATRFPRRKLSVAWVRGSGRAQVFFKPYLKLRARYGELNSAPTRVGDPPPRHLTRRATHPRGRIAAQLVHRQFHGRTIVIQYGGSASATRSARGAFARDWGPPPYVGRTR